MAPLLTSLASGPSARASLDDLSKKSAKIKLSKLPRIVDSGTEEDDWKEAVERITAAAENYETS